MERQLIPPGGEGGDEQYPVMVREYNTPAGKYLMQLSKPAKNLRAGLFNQIMFLLSKITIFPGQRNILSVKLQRLTNWSTCIVLPMGQRKWYNHRISSVRKFSEKHGLFVQAWTAFGMDAVIWFTGVDNAVTMSMTEPEAFRKLIDIIAATDYARTELAVKTPGIDMVCQRGWYSSTNFWSPESFRSLCISSFTELTALAHKYGKKFGYVMTTGVEILGPRLADAGVDFVFFVDPVQDKLSLSKAEELFGNRMTMVGGINSINLNSDDHDKIRLEVKEAIEILGPTNRFILHPVDAIFPDTPWKSVEVMINAWKQYR